MNDSNIDDEHNHNWLEFSLSPHMKMDHHYYHENQQPSSSLLVPSNFYMSPSSICHGFGENTSFHHSSLSMMPLISHESLCIMDSFTTSQTQQGLSFSHLFLPFFLFTLICKIIINVIVILKIKY